MVAPSDAIINRVRKLLALSESPNVNEAASAAAKAQELILKYNLDLAQIDTGEDDPRKDYMHETIGLGVKRGQVTNWRRDLMLVLAKYNLCKAIPFIGMPIISIIGQPHNVEMVQHLYVYLTRQFDRLADEEWDAVKRNNGGKAPIVYSQIAGNHTPLHAKKFKSSFGHGAVVSVGQRLRDAMEDADAQTTALVVTNEEELERAQDRFINPKSLVKRDAGPAPDYASAFSAGVEAGQNVPLNRPIESSDSSRQLLKG